MRDKVGHHSNSNSHDPHFLIDSTSPRTDPKTTEKSELEADLVMNEQGKCPTKILRSLHLQC